MNRTVVFSTAALLALASFACGGRQSVASRSAAAYREAAKSGAPIESGHGGHAGPVPVQSTSATATDHAAMDHVAMGHSAPAGGSTGGQAGMQHGTTQHDPAQHGAMQQDTSSADHSGHTMTANIPAGGLWGPVPGSQPVLTAAPSPSATLRPDAYDAPAAISVSEANKSKGKEQ